MQLNQIANIQTGLFARTNDEGEVNYLQSKHFDEDGNLIGEILPTLMASNISKKHFLKTGDVLFAAKGYKNFAVVFDGHIIPTVASTSFFVIRLKVKNVIPKYLAWVLNSQQSQTLLKSKALGTSIPSISKEVLKNFEVSIPSIGTQNNIIKVSYLSHKEKSIRLKIQILREKLIQAKLQIMLSDEF